MVAVKRNLFQALLSQDVLRRIYGRHGAVKGLAHWINTTLTIAQERRFIDDDGIAVALKTLSKLNTIQMKVIAQ